MTDKAKTRQNAYLEMATKARTLLHTNFEIISMHWVCQETFFFCRKQQEGGGGGILDYVPFWAPRAI